MTTKFKSPIIGITALWDDQKQSLWMLPNYYQAIEKAGGIPLILPLLEQENAENNEIISSLLGACDGILFTGGHDINPEIYHAENTNTRSISLARDAIELTLFQKAYEMDMPILGICRGFQLINAALGGTLYQDLPIELGTQVDHEQKAPYDRFFHSVKLENTLADLFSAAEIEVNSSHHQGVKELANSLVCCARSEDGLVEAFSAPDKNYLLAVQWHPEYGANWDSSKKIFSSFIEAAKESM